MRHRLVLTLCIVLLLSLLTGCQEKNRNGHQDEDEKNPEEVSQFPTFLVGTWKAEDKSGWQINLTPDGNISSAVISMGRFKIKPGQKAEIPMKGNKKSIVEPGLWQVNYSLDDRRLMVFIEQKYIHVEIGDGVVEGQLTDIIDGTVSKDGSIWSGTWTTFLNARSHTSKYKDFDLSTNPDYGESKEITLIKVRNN